MMSGNDEEEEYNIINGEIPAPKQSYYKSLLFLRIRLDSTAFREQSGGL